MIVIPPKQKGYAILAMTLVVLLAVTLLSIFISKFVISDHHSVQYTYRAQQAHQAAQAGLEYGIKYAEKNKETITNGQILTGSLTNSATYSAQINFVGASNETIEIISTGTSADTKASSMVRKIVKWFEGSSNISMQVPLMVRGAVAMSGNAEVKNLENDNTIDTGAAVVTLNGNAKTTLSTGTSSDKNTIEADVNVNNTTLAGYSAAEFGQSILGDTLTNISSQLITSATVTHTNTGTTNYNSELDGLSGEIIYLNQNGGTVTLNSNTDIGTADNPVTIIVDGSITISGNAEIYGDIVVSGNMTLSGNTNIHGDAVAEGALSISGNTDINGLAFASGSVSTSGNTDIVGGLAVGGTYSASGNTEIDYNAVNLMGGILTSTGSYGSISGSWKDY